MLGRRKFCASAAAFALTGCRTLCGVESAGTRCSWKRGHFQIHQIYTGKGESLFLIFPDGTTLLLFFSAGDYTASDGRKGMWEGKALDIEQILAKACGPVSVAKANHHACWGNPASLIATLRPKVWTIPVWWQLHATRQVMNRLASREIYSGERTILPGVLCPERRTEDAGEPYLASVPAAVHMPSHIVVDVPPGGDVFTVSCLDAAGETLRVKAHWSLES